MNKKNKTCFLDRDGVLIREVNYLSSPEQVSIFSEAINALKMLRKNGYKIIVITNQAGVARGYFTEQDVLEVHAEIDRQLLAENLSIDAYYYCPHHPDGVVDGYNIDCDCRKPKPSLILQAVKDFDIDLHKSFLIGDKVTDLLAADNAGCSAALVKTGHGIEHVAKAEELNFKVFDNIENAVIYFINE
jgi:D-glycero-D-manno-heptose 1,7-bisphosphate phosphatase